MTAPAIVLVRPQLGENIGTVARAMLNFGLTDLRLVNPRDGWPNPDAGPAASGADVVLAEARVYDSVGQAVADCRYIYATTVRPRDLWKPTVTPAQAAGEIRGRDFAQAILFGAERSGLATDELATANAIMTVPVNPAFKSLNLAQAVLLAAYEWFKAADATPPIALNYEPPATHGALEGLIDQTDAALEAAAYYRAPSRVASTKRIVRNLLTRPGWSEEEVRTMRGIVASLSKSRN